MKNIVNRVKRVIAKLQEKKLNYTVERGIKLERLGSDYGGWVIPTNFLNHESICYCVGAGLDITFDLALAQKYKCKIHILDPTPGAISHFQELNENTKKGLPTFTNHTGKKYELQAEDLEYMNFFDVGLWNEDTILKFFAPQNKEHISHSALNLQGTEEYFEAHVQRPLTFMNAQNHSKIHLLKLDVEGAEYKVVKSIIGDNLEIDVLCIEFDENIKNNLDKNYIRRIQNTLDRLRGANYLILHTDNENNFTLAKMDIVRRLTK